MQCRACDTDAPDDDRFCENCGAELLAPPAGGDLPLCPCGADAGELDEDGFCLRCGRRVLRPASDHIEEAPSADFAAVSDRGVRHDRNEDRFALFAGAEGYALAVCDGVSASTQSEVASQAVSVAVRDALAEALRSGLPQGAPAAMRGAIAAGLGSLGAPVEADEEANPPSTTAVAALVAQGVATVGWVGDSRAYWIDAAGARALTVDHSWRNEVVAAGQMTAEEAERAPQAHAITRWLGADAGEAGEPEVLQHEIAAPGTLLLCTDGLWNYAPTPEAMTALVREAAGDGVEALGMVRRLVQFANERGGHDNITAVALRF